jgi:hypothetical protein
MGRAALHDRWGVTRRKAAIPPPACGGCCADQRLGRNPCNGVTLPRLQPKLQRHLNHGQLQALADQAGPYRTMILVLGWAGRSGRRAAGRRRNPAGVSTSAARCRRSTAS